MDNTVSLDIISPAFTDVHMRYQETDRRLSGSVSSPSAGTLGYLIEMDTDILTAKVYYRTQVSLIYAIKSTKLGMVRGKVPFESLCMCMLRYKLTTLLSKKNYIIGN